MPKRISLEYKIMLLTIAMVCLVLITAGVLVIKNLAQNEREEISKRALDIARMVATVPAVQQALQSDNPSAVLQPLAERWRIATGAAHIVIANMEQVRLSHPITENIGTPMADLYREPVLHGEEYTYIGQGSLAPSLRANVPIFAPDGRQIGFVSVGFYLQDIASKVMVNAKQVMFALVLALAGSVVGAIVLARNVKQTIFGLEPYQIAAILKERNATMEALREGVVAVDCQGIIRMLNTTAASLWGLKPTEAVGMPIDKFLPQNRLSTVIATGTAVYDEEQRVNDTIILANSVPVVVDGSVLGAVVTFRDRTEISRLAEEITGVHRFVDLLRAQNHEFKNKLHAIAGLIQLGKYEQAVDFIIDSYAQKPGTVEQLRCNINDAVTFGLLLGKSIRARELGINFTIDPETSLAALPAQVTSGDMVIILGNLIENAIDAVSSAEHKSIYIKIADGEDGVLIRIVNSGPSIPAELAEQIYRRGVTTKGSNRGYGLALVAEKVKVNRGTVAHCNLADGGVEFTVFLPY